jgi:hypothetical protein
MRRHEKEVEGFGNGGVKMFCLNVKLINMR